MPKLFTWKGNTFDAERIIHVGYAPHGREEVVRVVFRDREQLLVAASKEEARSFAAQIAEAAKETLGQRFLWFKSGAVVRLDQVVSVGKVKDGAGNWCVEVVYLNGRQDAFVEPSLESCERSVAAFARALGAEEPVD